MKPLSWRQIGHSFWPKLSGWPIVLPSAAMGAVGLELVMFFGNFAKRK